MDQDLRSAQLTISSNPASSTVMNFTGFGAVPEVNLSSNNINFGTNVPLNIGTLNLVELTNTGGAHAEPLVACSSLEQTLQHLLSQQIPARPVAVQIRAALSR